MSKFQLAVEGDRYEGWKSIRISRGLERATSDFTLSVSERWPMMEVPMQWQIEPGMECELFIDDELIMTGWVDAYRPSLSSDAHEIQLTGRSKTQDFVDCSITGEVSQFKKMTILEIARKLAEPFDIEVIADVPSDSPAASSLEDELALIDEPEAQCQPGETCFAFTERLARLQELLITDDKDGRLVLTRAGNRYASDALVQGENVKSASSNIDDSKRYSTYIVKAQRPGNRGKSKKSAKGQEFSATFVKGTSLELSADEWRAAWRAERLRVLRQGPRRDPVHVAHGAPKRLVRAGGEDGWEWEWEDYDEPPIGGGTDTELDRGAKVFTQVTGQATDEGIRRYRPKVIIAETQADDEKSTKRADWEMRRRIAKAIDVSISICGWRQRNGALWEPNMMVQCEIPWISLDRELLISAVDYIYSNEDGEVCNFKLTLPDAFLPEKFRKAKRQAGRGKGGKGKRGNFYSATFVPGT